MILAAAFVSGAIAPLLTFVHQVSSNANTGVLCATLGLLLLYVECNRPGRVVPGAFGCLLLLLGLYALRHTPLRPVSVGLILLAFAVLTLPLRLRLTWSALLAGTTFLTLGLATLVAGRPFFAVGAACGLLLGPATGWLTVIAGQARRAKRRVHSARIADSPTLHIERWE